MMFDGGRAKGASTTVKSEVELPFMFLDVNVLGRDITIARPKESGR